jgi:hypothetical protein
MRRLAIAWNTRASGADVGKLEYLQGGTTVARACSQRDRSRRCIARARRQDKATVHSVDVQSLKGAAYTSG